MQVSVFSIPIINTCHFHTH